MVKQAYNQFCRRDESPVVPAHANGRRSAIAVLSAACLAGAAHAGEIQLENGVEGQWLVDASLGASWRTMSPDSNLIAVANGGKADGSAYDDGTLNYKRGDNFSTLAKVIGELKLKQGDYGVFLRAKAWYDYTQKNEDVAFGNFSNGYQSGKPLSDRGFQPLSRFEGAELLDAYAFGTFYPSDSATLSLKAGNHAVNWGEALFISGINQYSPVDVAAARRPGAQLKEIILPVPQISANLGLGGGLSIEAFYQLKWKPTVLEGCGTYWGPADILNCSHRGAVFNPLSALPVPGADDQSVYNGTPLLGGANAQISYAGNAEPKDSGQWGLAGRYYMSEIGLDLGAYYVNYHSRTPIFSMVRSPTTIPGSLFGVLPGQYFWDSSAENIKVLGLSASTEVAGWALFGELSYSKGVPVQINTNDLAAWVLTGTGPLVATKGAQPALGSVVHGYDRKNKTQIQLSTLKVLPGIFGAESTTLIGEIGYQRWSGIGDPSTSVRYGRSSLYGMAASATTPCATVMSDYCAPNGFATTNAWGYRVQASFSYPNAVADINLTPQIFWSQDVDGYSADGTFLKDRQALGLSVRAEMQKKYYATLSYSHYNHNAKYDAYRDRDYISLVAGVTF